MTMSWWRGSPVRSGRVIESQSVDVDLFAFEGCRGVGGDEVQCSTVKHMDGKSPLGAGIRFAAAGLATFVFALLGVALLVGQGLASAAGRQVLRRRLAIASVITILLLLGAGILFVITPDVRGVPLYWPPYGGLGGAGLGLLLAAFALGRQHAVPAGRSAEPSTPVIETVPVAEPTIPIDILPVIDSLARSAASHGAALGETPSGSHPSSVRPRRTMPPPIPAAARAAKASDANARAATTPDDLHGRFDTVSDVAGAADVPRSTAPPDLSPPTLEQLAADGPMPACPICDAPMSWVEKHLRFFCSSCRMYA